MPELQGARLLVRIELTAPVVFPDLKKRAISFYQSFFLERRGADLQQTNTPWVVRARASNWMIKLVKTGLTALTYNTKTTHFRSRRCMHA